MITSGRQTLASIDQALQEVRRQVQDLDERIQSSGEQLVRLRQAEAEQYKALAKVRLGQLASGEVIAGLDQADQHVGELLAARESQLQALQGQIEESQQKHLSLESEREAQAKNVAEAAETLDASEAATQERLKQEPAYQEQLEKAHKADATANRAEAKTEQAKQDRAEKGKPYEEDRLFMYLWERGYGTSRYRANLLARFLDRKVARLCDYDDARPNYAMLLEIPLRLSEHAERLRDAADQEFEALKALEEAAAEADGIPAVREALDKVEQRLDEIDERILREEERFEKLMEERAKYAAGEDDYLRKSIDVLVAEFQRDDIVSLRRQAEATPTAEDDIAVSELSGIDQEKDHLEEALAHHKQVHGRHLARLQELEEVRREFKRHRYDDMHSVFADSALLLGMLNEFLRGMVTSRDLWRTISRHQRFRGFRSNPTFGTGGFGRRGGVWRSSRWSRPSPGRGGFGSGGGFRTGGGF